MVQWQPKIIVPAVLGLIFVMGFLFGNISKSCPEFTRLVPEQEVVQGKPLVSSGGKESVPKVANVPNEDGVIYVDLSEEEPTLPSIAKTVTRYLHEPVSCSKMENFNPSFVYFIFSVAARYDRRKAIRETWGKYIRPECGTRLIFVLSVIEGTEETREANEKLQKELDEESVKYKDILQFGQIIDGSRTLTQKARLTFEWFLRECPTAAYIAKGEDHTWVDHVKLSKFVTGLEADSVFGHRVYQGSPVFRDPKSYFYVSREDYKEDNWPEYMISMIYVIPKLVLEHLLEKAKEVHEIPLEDVYWTGLVADHAKISRKNTEGYEYDYIIDRNRNVKCPKKELIAVRYMPPTEFYKYEEDKCDTYPQCTPLAVQTNATIPAGVDIGR
ncbi:putative Lactosylceramide 1,3-N-acetyl-beta-D-glucosaminyltransferase [Hypsibius exemplaris]|uniref:Hexosyltransferase n=1 Tax=Hypsibius exemplaris TaxID=2072580 RepID=A0A1W0X0M2_HYPEX|nr:putative Lactosylceramide 1,3-N-acetyl-beta-D-glucosaminyltransferase [Hypsibius exemplaris]